MKVVTAVDKLTVKFKLTKPTGPFLTYMAFPGSSIVPKKLVESGHDLNEKPVGSGPFQFVSYEPRSVIKFERNPNFFETGKPYFDAMEFRIITDGTALTDAVMSGEVEFFKRDSTQGLVRRRRQSGTCNPSRRGVAVLLASTEQSSTNLWTIQSSSGYRPSAGPQGAS